MYIENSIDRLHLLYCQAGYDSEMATTIRNKASSRLPVQVATAKYTCGAKGHIKIMIATDEALSKLCAGVDLLGYVPNLLNWHRMLAPNPLESDSSLLLSLISGLCQEAGSPYCSCYWDQYISLTTDQDLCDTQIQVELVQTAAKAAQVAFPTKKGHKRMAIRKAWELKSCSIHERRIVKIMFMARERKCYDGLNELFPAATEGDWAHTRLDLETALLTVSRSAILPKKELLLRMNLLFELFGVGSYNSTLSGLLIGVSSYVSVYEMLLDFKARSFCCLSTTKALQKLKDYGNALRRTHTNPEGVPVGVNVIAECSYWQMCSSRQLSMSDWQQERINRMSPIELRHVMGRDFNVLVKAEIDRCARKMVSLAKRPLEWAVYVRERQRHVASGSTGGVKTMLDGTPVTAGKRVYFENVKTEEVLAWLQTVPAIIASASEKYELGKSRAIYGTQPIDYFIMGYVITGLEQVMEGLQGVQHTNRSPESVRRMCHRHKVINGSCPYGMMLDYSDFNIQHTLYIQSYIFDRIAHYSQRFAWPQSYVQAAEWCRAALLNSQIRFPGDAAPTRILQGLFSGLRGTAFCNSLLNYSYYRAAEAVLTMELPMLSADTVAYHQGDDVWVSSSRREHNVAIYHIMAAAGLQFEPSKQNMAKNVGEFLRVWYQDGQARGFIPRALASLIIAPLQSDRAVDFIEEARALDGQLRVLQRRGLPPSMLSALWRSLVIYNVKKSFKPTGPPDATIEMAISSSALYGGLGCPNPASGTPLRLRRQVNPRPTLSRMLDIPKNAASYMSSDLIALLPNEIASYVDIGSLALLLKRSNYSNFSPAGVKPTDINLAQYRKDVLRWVKQFTNKAVLHDPAGSNQHLNPLLTHDILIRMVNGEVAAFKRIICSEDSFVSQIWGGSLSAALQRVFQESSFSTIHEVMTAASCGIREAYSILIATCRDHDAAASLASLLDGIFRNLRPNISQFWMSHMCSLPTVLLNNWHPDIASYIHMQVWDKLLWTCTVGRINDYRTVISAAYDMEEHLYTMSKNDVLLRDLSHF